MPRIDIRRDDLDGLTWFVLEGELDLAGAREIVDRRMLACDGRPRVVVDTRPLRFIDLAGLRLLIGLEERLREAGSELSIIAGARVRRLAELTNLADRVALETEPDTLLGLTTIPTASAGGDRTSTALRDQVAAEILRQEQLVERMRSLAESASALLMELRRTTRFGADGRARHAAPG